MVIQSGALLHGTGQAAEKSLTPVTLAGSATASEINAAIPILMAKACLPGCCRANNRCSVFAVAVSPGRLTIFGDNRWAVGTGVPGPARRRRIMLMRTFAVEWTKAFNRNGNLSAADPGHYRLPELSRTLFRPMCREGSCSTCPTMFAERADGLVIAERVRRITGSFLPGMADDPLVSRQSLGDLFRCARGLQAPRALQASALPNCGQSTACSRPGRAGSALSLFPCFLAVDVAQSARRAFNLGRSHWALPGPFQLCRWPF